MTAVLRVVAAGALTTVQDLGRPHAIGSGVSPGGAMDRFAHRAANLIAGNDEGDATLECTVSGPRLVAKVACVIAVTGADFDLRVNGTPVPAWSAVALSEGDELSFAGRRAGGRAYIAVAGGIAADRWLGSLSTNLLAQRGGMGGRALAAGDVIDGAGHWTDPAGRPRHFDEALRPRYSDHTLKVIAGPDLQRLGAAGRKLLLDTEFAVGRDSDRMGYRLEGPALAAPGDELLSFGLVAGVLQVPPGGRPVLLMADHPTAGGYPVVATVASASMPVAAQLIPGDWLRFEEISLEDALRLRADQREALDSLIS